MKKKRRTESISEPDQPFIAEVDIEKEFEIREKQKLFASKMAELPDDSRQVLQLFFNKTRLKVIAERMGYTEAYAKKKKYKAKQQLIAAIKNDVRFEQLNF